jgi:hypothetical protein
MLRLPRLLLPPLAGRSTQEPQRGMREQMTLEVEDPMGGRIEPLAVTECVGSVHIPWKRPCKRAFSRDRTDLNFDNLFFASFRVSLGSQA